MESKELLNLYYLILEQIEDINKRLVEFSAIKEVLENLENINRDIYVNLGGMIFAKAELKDKDNLVVNVGDNIFVEKDRKSVLEIVNKQIEDLNSYKKELETQLIEIKKQLESLKESQQQ